MKTISIESRFAALCSALIFGLIGNTLSAATTTSPSGASVVWLDTLDLKGVEQEWGTARARRSIENKPITIDGQSYEHGVGTHVASEMHISVDGRGSRFIANVGIDDESGGRFDGGVVFEVIGDGKSLWKSQPLRGRAPAQSADVDITGVKTLSLHARSLGDITYGHVDWADARLVMAEETSAPRIIAATLPAEEPYILTPPPAPQPRINSARVFGVRPGRPFLYTVAATGERPMTFTADGLPAGLTLDEKTGRITGALAGAGEHVIKLTARNERGSAEQTLKIVVGDQIALTPPLGWNSWNCWAGAVDQEKVLRSARAMVTSGLRDHGWTYVNIDDTWQGNRGGEFNAIQGNEKFPDMKALCDEIHAMGLKPGIYSTPWKTSYARYRGGSSDDPDGAWQPPAPRQTTRPATTRTATTQRVRVNPLGKYSFAAADAKQWAVWGFDYLKYDWNPNDVPHVQEMADALRESGRDVIYSLSNSAPFDSAADWARLSNCWRTTGDITDTWKSMSNIGFAQARWAPFAGPGHWNDPDMLVVGYVGWGPRLHPSRLTPSEQYTHISLWSLLAAPLLIGCDLDRLDPFTISLLTNDEVLAIDQDPLGKQATCILKTGNTQVWARPLEGGDMAVGLFNLGSSEAPVTAKWSDLKLDGKHSVRDVWRQKDVEPADEKYEATVRPHGVVLIRVSTPK